MKQIIGYGHESAGKCDMECAPQRQVADDANTVIRSWRGPRDLDECDRGGIEEQIACGL